MCGWWVCPAGIQETLGLPPQSKGKGEGPVSCREAESGGHPGPVRPDLPGTESCAPSIRPIPLWISQGPEARLRAQLSQSLELGRVGGTPDQRPHEASPGSLLPHWGPQDGVWRCLRGPAFAVSGISLGSPRLLSHKHTSVSAFGKYTERRSLELVKLGGRWGDLQ